MALFADVAYEAPYVSLSLNRKLSNVLEPGIYNGFDIIVAFGAVKATAGTAILERDGFSITVQSTGVETVTPPEQGDTDYYIVIDAQYVNLGDEANPTFPPGGSTTVDVLWVDAAGLQAHHVIIGMLNRPASAQEWDTSHVYFNERRLPNRPNGWREFALASGEAAEPGHAAQLKADGTVQEAKRVYNGNYSAAPRDDKTHTTSDERILHIAALDQTHFVYLNKRLSVGTQVRARIVYARGLEYTEGAETVWSADPDDLDEAQIEGLTAVRVIAAYKTVSDNYPAVRLIDWDVPNLALSTLGSEKTAELQACKEITVARLDDTHAVVTWVRTATSELCAAVFDTATQTFGSIAVLSSNVSAGGVAALATNKAVVAYSNTTLGSGKAMELNVSGTTITPGTDTTFEASFAPTRTAVDAYSANGFLLAYHGSGAPGAAYVKVGDLTAGSFSFSSRGDLNTDSTSISKGAILNIDGSRALAGSRRAADKPRVSFVNFTAPATLGTITTTKALDAPSYEDFGMVLMEDGGVLVPTSIATTGKLHRITTGLTEDRRTSFIGIFQARAPAGASKVPVLLRHFVSEVHSGLSTGSTMYIDTDGSITTENTTYQAGTALTDTDLLIE
ncbi:MAG: hypothetical protein ACE5FJ_08670 [Gemmatimonadales bacterium]